MIQLQEDLISGSNAATADMMLEVVFIPISDGHRATDFYGRRLEWRLGADLRFDNGFRVVQFTPAGSGASIQFGTKVTRAAPGPAQSQYLVVPDIVATRDHLVCHGVDIS